MYDNLFNCHVNMFYVTFNVVFYLRNKNNFIGVNDTKHIVFFALC